MSSVIYVTLTDSIIFRYHKSYFKSFSKKQNLKPVARSSAENEASNMTPDLSNSLLAESSVDPLDTPRCIICKNMSHKKMKTFHTISSAKGVANLTCRNDDTVRAGDVEMSYCIE